MNQPSQSLATRSENGALATEQDLAPRFVVSLADLKAQILALDEFKREIMQPKSDYDTLPGTDKPTLLKPGAEKLVTAFGHVAHFTTVKEIQDWEVGFFYYQIECSLVNRRTGLETANGLGSCNTKEARYRWRDAKPLCFACSHELNRQKPPADGWYCWQKKGGCGANYSADQVPNMVGRVENDDTYTLDNTVLKMAQKRALVAAVLVGFNASAIFTQDVEDYADVSGTGETRRSEPEPARTQAAAPSRSNGNGNGNGQAAERDYTPFWARAKGKPPGGLGLTDKRVHEILGVASIKDVPDLTAAMATLEAAVRKPAQQPQVIEAQAREVPPDEAEELLALWSEYHAARATAAKVGVKLGPILAGEPNAETLQAAMGDLGKLIARAQTQGSLV